MRKVLKLLLIFLIFVCLFSCGINDSLKVINSTSARNYITQQEVKTYNYLDYFHWIEHHWKDTNPATDELYTGTQQILILKDGYIALNNYVSFSCSYSVTRETYRDGSKSMSTWFDNEQYFTYGLPSDNNIYLKGDEYIENAVNLPLVTSHGSTKDVYTFDSIEITYANGVIFEVNIPDEYWYESSEEVQGISAHKLGKYFIYNNNGNIQRFYEGGYVANLSDQSNSEIDNLFNVYDCYSMSVYQYFLEEVLNS